MNRYRALMEKCAPDSGFQERLRERVFAARPETRRIYRPRPALKTAVIVAIIVLAMAVAAGAVYIAAHWDPIFVRRFSPSEQAAAQMEKAVQTFPVSSRCGDVTLTIRQVIGDDQTIYAVLDVTLPDTVRLSELLDVSPETGEPDLNIIPYNVQYFSADASYEEIEGMTFEEIEQSFYIQGKRFPSGTSSGVESQAADLKTNTLTYLLHFSADQTEVVGQPLTILIDGLYQWTGSDYKEILEGPFLISWTPEYDGISYTYEIRDGKNTAGTVSLSPFAIKVELYSSDFEDFSDFEKTLSIKFRDGTTFLPSSSGFGGSFSKSSGTIKYNRFFKEILTIDDVVSIQVGGYLVRLK